MTTSPSRSRIKLIGKALVDGDLRGDLADDLDNILIAAELAQLDAVATLQPWLAERGYVIRGRAKTRETLREKLARMGGHQLPVIRDLAGIRIVGEMRLSEQNSLLEACCDLLGMAPSDVKIVDRRSSPSYGYRALHAEVSYGRATMELQVRTTLQHHWAEAYEKLGDQLGREIRYSDDLAHLSEAARAQVESMQHISRRLAEVEELADQLHQHRETVQGLEILIAQASAQLHVAEDALHEAVNKALDKPVDEKGDQ